MKYLIILFMTFLFPFCLVAGSYTEIADPIFESFQKEMHIKHGYAVCATGGSMKCNDVRSLFMSFVGKQKVDIPKARRLYIELFEGLLIRVNSNKIIRPHLHEYPITRRNIRIDLGFEGNDVTEKDIAFIMCAKDIIYYYVMDKTTGDYVTVFEESYEEALKILQDESFSK